MKPDGTCWIDGEPGPFAEASIPLDDPAFHSGWGLFETLAIREGRALDVEAHLRRLDDGACRLGLGIGNRADLSRTIDAAARENDRDRGFIRVVVTGASRSVVYAGAVDREQIGAPATACLLPWRRCSRDPLVGFKTLSYAGSQIGTGFARARGADEGLWRNEKGLLTEGCTSNLFVIAGRRLHTASINEGVLPGTVRDQVLALASEAGLVTHVGKLRVDRLRRADEAFITSSVREIRPLIRFERKAVGSGRPGRTTVRLQELFGASRARQRASLE